MESQTDWARIDAMKDEDIDYSDILPITDEIWEKGFVKKRKFDKGETESVIVDNDIIEFFKKQEGDYTENINRLLRKYVEAHQTEKFNRDVRKLFRANDHNGN